MGNERFDIQSLARGAVMEQFEIELQKVIENIMNPNTPFKSTRKIKLELSFKPNDEDRDIVTVQATSKSTLAAYSPINMQMAVGKADGEYVAEEIAKGQIKGQTSIDEIEQNSKVVSMNKEAK